MAGQLFPDEVYQPSVNWHCLLTTALTPLSKHLLRHLIQASLPLSQTTVIVDYFNPNYWIDLAGNLEHI